MLGNINFKKSKKKKKEREKRYLQTQLLFVFESYSGDALNTHNQY